MTTQHPSLPSSLDVIHLFSTLHHHTQPTKPTTKPTTDMAGCLKLCFWKKRSKAEPAAVTKEKPFFDHAETVIPSPPWAQQRSRAAPASRGVPVRANVDPVCSAYSTPVDTRWADSATSQKFTNSLELKDEGGVDPEEARRKKAEQEEQERLDFFQMM